jgi:hypothetical protein
MELTGTNAFAGELAELKAYERHEHLRQVAELSIFKGAVIRWLQSTPPTLGVEHIKNATVCDIEFVTKRSTAALRQLDCAEKGPRATRLSQTANCRCRSVGS